MKNKFVRLALYTLLALLFVVIGVKVFYTKPVTYQADTEPVQTIEEKQNIEDRADVKKRIELAKKQIVLEAQRADEVKRHEDEMARLESELDTVRTAQVSL